VRLLENQTRQRRKIHSILHLRKRQHHTNRVQVHAVSKQDEALRKKRIVCIKKRGGKNMNQQPIFTYSRDKKTLTVTREVELKDKDKTVGTRKISDVYDHDGIKGYYKALNEQINEFQKRYKNLQQQAEELKDIEIDEEFLEKFEAVQKANKKQTTQQNMEATEDALKNIKQELLQLQKSGAPIK